MQETVDALHFRDHGRYPAGCRCQHKLSQSQSRFEKYDLVICDEFGYVFCDKEGAELIFNHLSLRAGTRSTIITTNLAFSRWNGIIPDKVLVNALVDRLTHKAKIINMTGTSLRLKQTQLMIKNQIRSMIFLTRIINFAFPSRWPIFELATGPLFSEYLQPERKKVHKKVYKN